MERSAYLKGAVLTHPWPQTLRHLVLTQKRRKQTNKKRSEAAPLTLLSLHLYSQNQKPHNLNLNCSMRLDWDTEISAKLAFMSSCMVFVDG